MLIKELLTQKASDVFTIDENKTLADCLAILNEKRIGILVVKDKNDTFVGVVSERDVLRSVAKQGQDYAKVLVNEAMTPRARIFSVPKEEYFEKVMSMMTENRVRHIPVMDGEKVLGIISIGDLMKNLLESAQFENEQLKKYISGAY